MVKECVNSKSQNILGYLSQSDMTKFMTGNPCLIKAK